MNAALCARSRTTLLETESGRIPTKGGAPVPPLGPVLLVLRQRLRLDVPLRFRAPEYAALGARGQARVEAPRRHQVILGACDLVRHARAALSAEAHCETFGARQVEAAD